MPGRDDSATRREYHGTTPRLATPLALGDFNTPLCAERLPDFSPTPPVMTFNWQNIASNLRGAAAIDVVDHRRPPISP